MKYQEFIYNKLSTAKLVGIDEVDLNDKPLFPHQSALCAWALRKGRTAIFADTGLGKTRMQLVWADIIAKYASCNVLILCPLAVAAQTVLEGIDIGINVKHIRFASDVEPGINIVNYDRLHLIDTRQFGAVVLDESSIIKHHDAKTFALLTEAFRTTPYKLCCTATPSPNDFTELGTHAEFLGICSRAEMLSEFFVHDGGSTQDWRLKGHAKHVFWKWVSSWGAMIRSPADLGFDATAYNLPPLNVHQITVGSDAEAPEGELFPIHDTTLSGRRNARRASMSHRIDACAITANATNEPRVIWTELNAEGELLRSAIPGSVEISGADSTEKKEAALQQFASGEIRVLITKPKIAGFGLNWQHCNQVDFIGVTDSFESYYQAIRRCWRFGQKRPVGVNLYCSEAEGHVKNNLMRKEKAAIEMLDILSRETRESLRDEVIGQKRQTNTYIPNSQMKLPAWMENAR